MHYGRCERGLTLDCPVKAGDLRQVLTARHSRWLAELLVLIDRRGVSDERRFVTIRCELP